MGFGLQPPTVSPQHQGAQAEPRLCLAQHVREAQKRGQRPSDKASEPFMGAAASDWHLGEEAGRLLAIFRKQGWADMTGITGSPLVGKHFLRVHEPSQACPERGLPTTPEGGREGKAWLGLIL